MSKTNTEILNTPSGLLGSMDRQRQYILQMHSYGAQCPNPGCAKPVNVFQALGVSVDEYSYAPNRTYTCPHCHYRLAYVVPLVMMTPGGYHWMLGEALPVKVAS